MLWINIKAASRLTPELAAQARRLLDQLGGPEEAVAAIQGLNVKGSWITAADEGGPAQKPGLAQTLSDIGQATKGKIAETLVNVLMVVLGWTAAQIVHNPSAAINQLQQQLAEHEGYPERAPIRAPTGRERLLTMEDCDDPNYVLYGQRSEATWGDFFRDLYKGQVGAINPDAFDELYVSIIWPRIRKFDKDNNTITVSHMLPHVNETTIRNKIRNSFNEFVREHNKRATMQRRSRGR